MGDGGMDGYMGGELGGELRQEVCRFITKNAKWEGGAMCSLKWLGFGFTPRPW